MARKIIHALRSRGIDARREMPDTLKRLSWYTHDQLPDPDLSVMFVLKEFKRKFGVLPRLMVLNFDRHEIRQWHPMLIVKHDVGVPGVDAILKHMREKKKGGIRRKTSR